MLETKTKHQIVTQWLEWSDLPSLESVCLHCNAAFTAATGVYTVKQNLRHIPAIYCARLMVNNVFVNMLYDQLFIAFGFYFYVYILTVVHTMCLFAVIVFHLFQSILWF